jgi:hypothetical protein
MEQSNRQCPACGSRDYTFRSRRQITDEAQRAQWETKYRCKACAKDWKERVPNLASKQPRD